MLLYRIIHKKYIDPFYAPGLAGRWNGSGRRVLYTAENLPLAFMENMIRRQGAGFNRDFKTLVFELPENLPVKTVIANDLPANWRNPRNYNDCQKIGDAWYDGGDELALKVPSAVVSSSYNFVINTTLSDFKKIRLVAETELIPDERIDELLKNR